MTPNKRLEFAPYGRRTVAALRAASAAQAWRWPAPLKRPFSLLLHLILMCAYLMPVHTSASGLLLDCTRFEGEDQFQVYIDEAAGYVLYNAQFRQTYERVREYAVTDGAPGETIVIDEGLDITANSPRHIQAGDETSSFVLAKENVRFAYAWTILFPNESGELIPMGLSHQGQCSSNPFDRSSP